MSLYNPRIDFAFKKLFGSEENQDILLAFINSILNTDPPIEQILLLNPYQPGSLPRDKTVILDVRAQDTAGRLYNIEMQVSDEVQYDQRALYYWSKLYQNQLKKGENYRDLKKAISIHILNFDLFHNEAGYHHIFRMMHVNSKRQYFEEMELHFIELQRFRQEHHSPCNALDRWAAFLSRAQEYDSADLPPEWEEDPQIVRAFNALATLSLNEEERALYEAREKWWMDEGVILDATLQKGIEQGIEQGVVQGRTEGAALTVRTIARKLLAAGQSLATVEAVTGCSQEVLRALQKSSSEG